MIGHLGTRVSALLDGQLGAGEADRCWAHVHECRECWDLVAREGWLKTQLAGLSRVDDPGVTPDALKGSLRSCVFSTPSTLSALSAPSTPPTPGGPRARAGLVLWGGTAVGAAVVGVLALGVAPGSIPADRRPPVTNLTQPVSTSADPRPSPGLAAASSARRSADPAAEPAVGLSSSALSSAGAVVGITNIGLSVSTHRLAGGIPGFKMVP